MVDKRHDVGHGQTRHGPEHFGVGGGDGLEARQPARGAGQRRERCYPRECAERGGGVEHGFHPAAHVVVVHVGSFGRGGGVGNVGRRAFRARHDARKRRPEDGGNAGRDRDVGHGCLAQPRRLQLVANPATAGRDESGEARLEADRAAERQRQQERDDRLPRTVRTVAARGLELGHDLLKRLHAVVRPPGPQPDERPAERADD